MIYSTVVSEGGPLPPPVEINGRLYPDDMPKEYTKFSFFEDIISLPPQYLNKWLILHGERPEIFKSMDHLDRSKLLFVLKGGTMNDSVRKYEKERNEKRTLETIDLTGEDGKPKRPRRSCTKK
ncbi:uncharacterized protein L199_004597 [Kwoniella botswanensis]|uniref:uncharacterized protein n=1 Tax=Kwoniella botswanensis TaxID=1268659 RepID=UPI00315DBDD3